MKPTLLFILMLMSSLSVFAQYPDDNVSSKERPKENKNYSTALLKPGTAPMESFNSVKNGYNTKLGWELRKGDTLQLGIGSRDRQSFNYIYSSPVSFTQMMDASNPIIYLSSNYNDKVAVIKKFGTIGKKKTGYHAYAVVGIGEMENYWIDIENAIEFGELIPTNPNHRPVYEPLEVKVVNNTSDKYDQLKKLKQLLDDGILSQDEFDKEKSEILSKQ